MELCEKIEGALVAYLQTQTFPDYFDTTLILPGETDATKDGQSVLAIVDDSTEEDPQFSGNFWHPVRVLVKTPSVFEDSDPASVDRHKAVAEVLQAAIMRDDLQTVLSAAIPDFTCFAVLDRAPMRDQAEDYWVSGYSFRVYAASVAL